MGKVHLLGQTLPAFDQLDCLRQRARPDVGLQREVVAAVAGGDINRRRQIIHRAREQLTFDLQALRLGGGTQACLHVARPRNGR